MSKKLNIIWILIDSARNFQTNIDDRGLPKSVLDFSKDSIYFKNVVTSAPSTIMSVSSIMTAKPSFLLSRSYDNVPDISKHNMTFPKLLSLNGYDVFGSIYFKHGREILSSLFGFIEKRFIPKGLSHRKDVWSNQDIFNVFKNIINKHNWNKPTFCYLHYNVRIDNNISKIIQNTIDEIKNKGLLENSLIVINSDHGYPMPERGWDPVKEKQNGWGHDKLMYNDNILTPLLIKYPQCKKEKYEELVSTLDIVPTICKILKIEHNWGEYGVNILKNKISRKNDLIRTDNRYISQSPYFTSIIHNNLKLIIEEDSFRNKNFELYDLNIDKEEKNNLFDINSNISKLMLEKYNQSESSFFEYHQKFLSKKWLDLSNLKEIVNAKKIYVILSSTKKFEIVAKQSLSNIFPQKEFYFLNIKENNLKKIDIGENKLTICLLESEIPWRSKHMIDFAKKMSNNLIYIDNNGLIIKNFINLRMYFNYFKKRKNILINDKSFLLEIISRVINKRILAPVK